MLNADIINKIKIKCQSVSHAATTNDRYSKDKSNMERTLKEIARYLEFWNTPDKHTFDNFPFLVESLYEVLRDITLDKIHPDEITALVNTIDEDYYEIMDFLIAFLLKANSSADMLGLIDKITTDESYILREIALVLVGYNTNIDIKVLEQFCNKYNDRPYYIYRLKLSLSIMGCTASKNLNTTEYDNLLNLRDIILNSFEELRKINLDYTLEGFGLPF